MECLDANVVQDLMAGLLDTAARGVVFAHLDTCDECREMLAVTARDRPDVALLETVSSVSENEGLADTRLPTDPVVATPSGPRSAPAVGARLGRYQLLAPIGAGAMGVVWRAIDPELGRNVALKLLK